MGRRSSIDDLPPELRAAVLDAVKRGVKYDDIVATIAALGAKITRSAVGRWAQDYREMARQQRDLSSVAQAFASEFGEADDRQTRLLTQMMTSMLTRAVIPMMAGEEVDLDPKEFAFLARATKDTIAASKLDIEREAKIRDAAWAEAKRKAADVAEAAARRGGASSESIATIRAELLGMRAA